MKASRVDKPFVLSVFVLLFFGFFIFSSASLGLLTRSGASYSNVLWNQAIYGLLGGIVIFLITSNINYKYWRKFSFYLFILSFLASLLVFVPGVGFGHGGAHRWIAVGSFTIQPSEFLKIGFIIYFAAWASGLKEKIATFKSGFLPLLILLTVVAAVILTEPDTDTFMIIFFAGLAMYIAAGGKWRYVFMLFLVALVGVFFLALVRPYVMQRIITFIDPGVDSLGAGYQIQQSLIAIGSGGVFGRGFGQSIQKFNFLPEPIGDSVFAVAAEEFGFLGSISLIILYLFFASRALKIAIRSPDIFGRLTTVGIVILILSQSFINIAAMLGVVPLSGNVLIFVSHGATSLFMTMAEVGIIANISKYQTKA